LNESPIAKQRLQVRHLCADEWIFFGVVFAKPDAIKEEKEEFHEMVENCRMKVSGYFIYLIPNYLLF
jgi:hypothetical protein